MADTSHLGELMRTADSRRMSRLVMDHLEALAANDDHAQQKRLLRELIGRVVTLERRVNALLRNTLPEPVAEELKFLGRYAPRTVECTILFADMVGYTRLAEQRSAEELVGILDAVFSEFDRLVAERGGTKIKTIGDAYMAVFGAPAPTEDHPVRAVGAALGMLDFLRRFNRESRSDLQVRIGVHTGEVVAGVVGRDRMQYDVFGSVVNTASRFESSGVPGAVNVSEATWRRARDAYEFERRGRIELKNMGAMEAYLVREGS